MEKHYKIKVSLTYENAFHSTDWKEISSFCIPLDSTVWISLLDWYQVNNNYYSKTNSEQQAWLRQLVSSVTQSYPTLDHQPHRLQHARLPCPSPTPRACSNSCPWNQWCHPAISSSVVLFSSRLQSCPASVSFPMSQFFPSGGQSIGVSASASVLLMSIQDWFHLDWFIGSPCSPRALKSLLQHHSSKT